MNLHRLHDGPEGSRHGGTARCSIFLMMLTAATGLSACGSSEGSDTSVDAGNDVLADSPMSDGSDASDASDALPDSEWDGGVDGQSDSESDAEITNPRLVGTPVFKFSSEMVDMPWAKSPKLGTFANDVFLVSTVGVTAPEKDGTAVFRSKSSSAHSFGAKHQVGQTRGEPEFVGTDLRVMENGSVDVLFTDQRNDQGRPTSLALRRRSPSGDWGEAETIVSDDTFRPAVAMTGTSDRLDLFWVQQERVWHTSRLEGGSFEAPVVAMDARVETQPVACTLADGRAFFVVARDGAWAGIEEGEVFMREDIVELSDPAYMSGPSCASTPDGRGFAAFHDVTGGIFVAERSTEGDWDVTSPFPDQVRGSLSLVADSYGYLHLFWANGAGISYAYRDLDRTWSASAHASICSHNYWVHGAVTWNPARLRAHVVTEDSPTGFDKDRHVTYGLFEVNVE